MSNHIKKIRGAFVALLLVVTLANCGGPLSLLTGGGPNVAANVQAGQTNTQTIGSTEIHNQKLVRPQARTIEQSAGDTSVRSDAVENVRITNVDPWVLGLLLLFAGFVIPSPQEIAKKIRTRFKR